MAKGKGKKGKKDDAVEPDHDSSWERVRETQLGLGCNAPKAVCPT